MTYFKYPRTPHLPYSESHTDDDKVLDSDKHFYNMEKIIVTIKMDGENTTVYPNGFCHARSIDSNHREYHSWLLSDIRNWCYSIPEHFRICGEYLYAKHSIEYDNLPSYFLAFSLWERSKCCSWDESVKMFNTLGIKYVPVLYEGKYDKDLIIKLAKDTIKEGNEGIVIRNYNEFYLEDFSKNVAKYVRPNHVQTDKHWSASKIIKNRLIK